jgi:hypothetical protein
MRSAVYIAAKLAATNTAQRMKIKMRTNSQPSTGSTTRLMLDAM